MALSKLVRAAIVACVVAGSLALGAVGPTTMWAADAAAPRRARATIRWEHVPLGEAVNRLADVLNADVLVDRRVDPSGLVSLAIRNGSMIEILAQLAEDRSLGVAELGTLVYLGPCRSAEMLRTLAALRRQDVTALPGQRRMALERQHAVDWPRLTQPRQLVVDLLRERGWRVRRADLIPYDLWPAGRLPRLPLSDQLTVLLVGFDLTFRVDPDQRAVEIMAIGAPVRLARSYRWPVGTPPDADLLRRQFPDSLLHVDGRTVQLEGRLEDHERLAEMLQPARPGRQPPRQRRETRQAFTLRVEDQPAGVVLRQVERQLGLAIEVDEPAIRAAGLSLERRVSLSVDGADLDELLEAILAPAGLDFARQGQRVKVFPRRAQR